MTQTYNKLNQLLAELFQFDRSDLDFGIYRIMNQKRDEISKFLDQDLLPQVRQVFSQHQKATVFEVKGLGHEETSRECGS
jgi:adenine-specific DNA-methyltransferase